VACRSASLREACAAGAGISLDAARWTEWPSRRGDDPLSVIFGKCKYVPPDLLICRLTLTTFSSKSKSSKAIANSSPSCLPQEAASSGSARADCRRLPPVCRRLPPSAPAVCRRAIRTFCTSSRRPAWPLAPSPRRPAPPLPLRRTKRRSAGAKNKDRAGCAQPRSSKAAADLTRELSRRLPSG
jgi:hypothetical protein